MRIYFLNFSLIMSTTKKAILFLLFVQCSANFNLLSSSKKETARSILQGTLTQCNARGFVVFTSFCQDCRQVISQKFDAVLQCITSKMVSVLIDKRVSYNEMMATETRPILYLFSNHSFSQTESILHIRDLYDHFASRQSVTKILLVFILNKKYNEYKALLQEFFKRDVLDVDILEISVQSNSSFDYLVYQWNPFSQQFSSLKYNPSLEWFPNKLGNLHGHVFNVGLTSSKCLRLSMFTNNYSHCDKFYYKFNGIMSMMNASYKVRNVSRDLRNEKNFDVAIPKPSINEISRYTCIRPCKISGDRFLLPRLTAPVKVYNLKSSAVSFCSTALAVIVIFVWTYLSQYDRQTWCSAKIFGMIVGSANHRRLSGAAEIVTFIIVFAVGFYFGSQLTSGLTMNTIVMENDIELNCFEDLKNNNVALLTDRVNKRYLVDARKANLTIIPLIKSGQWETGIRQMLKHQNVSVQIKNTNSKLFPNKISVKEKVLGRIADILNTDSCINIYRLSDYSPYADRFSNFWWKYHEIGTTLPKNYYQQNRIIVKHLIDKAIEDFRNEDLDITILVNLNLEDISYLSLIASIVLPLSTLLVELCFYHSRSILFSKLCKLY